MKTTLVDIPTEGLSPSALEAKVRQCLSTYEYGVRYDKLLFLMKLSILKRSLHLETELYGFENKRKQNGAVRSFFVSEKQTFLHVLGVINRSRVPYGVCTRRV